MRINLAFPLNSNKTGRSLPINSQSNDSITQTSNCIIVERGVFCSFNCLPLLWPGIKLLRRKNIIYQSHTIFLFWQFLLDVWSIKIEREKQNKKNWPETKLFILNLNITYHFYTYSTKSTPTSLILCVVLCATSSSLRFFYIAKFILKLTKRKTIGFFLLIFNLNLFLLNLYPCIIENSHVESRICGYH